MAKNPFRKEKCSAIDRQTKKQCRNKATAYVNGKPYCENHFWMARWKAKQE